MPSILPNYLRTHRRRSDLTQDEVAFLLGIGRGSNVSRYERRVRSPGFEVSLAFLVLFDLPPAELFPGIYESVERQVLERASILIDELRLQKRPGISARKLAALEALVERRNEARSLDL